MEPMNQRSAAFSLVELLIVIAILGILLALTVPAVSSLLEGVNITRGAQLLESQIQLALQLASSKSRPIEIRLIKAGNLPNGGFRVVQLWQVDPPSGTNVQSARPVGRPEYLPDSICVSEDATKGSRLLLVCPATNAMPAGSALAGQAYAAFQIRPSGRVSPAMTMSSLYLTLVPTRDGSAQALPKNFATVQINPMTGTPRTYQP